MSWKQSDKWKMKMHLVIGIVSNEEEPSLHYPFPPKKFIYVHHDHLKGNFLLKNNSIQVPTDVWHMRHMNQQKDLSSYSIQRKFPLYQQKVISWNYLHRPDIHHSLHTTSMQDVKHMLLSSPKKCLLTLASITQSFASAPILGNNAKIIYHIKFENGLVGHFSSSSVKCWNMMSKFSTHKIIPFFLDL